MKTKILKVVKLRIHPNYIYYIFKTTEFYIILFFIIFYNDMHPEQEIIRVLQHYL